MDRDLLHVSCSSFLSSSAATPCVRTYNLSQFFSAPFSLVAQLCSARGVRILHRSVRRPPLGAVASPIQLQNAISGSAAGTRSLLLPRRRLAHGLVFCRAGCGRVKWDWGSERSCLLRTIGTCQVQEVVGFLFSLVRGACCFVFWRAGVWSPLFRLYSHLVSTFLSSHTWSTYLPLRVCLGNQKPCPCSSYSAGWLCYITITI